MSKRLTTSTQVAGVNIGADTTRSWQTHTHRQRLRHRHCPAPLDWPSLARCHASKTAKDRYGNYEISPAWSGTNRGEFGPDRLCVTDGCDFLFLAAHSACENSSRQESEQR